MFKLVLEKAEDPEIKLSTSAGSLKKQESSRKTSISAFFQQFNSNEILFWKHLNFHILKEIGIPDKLSWLLRNLFADQEKQLDPDMEQQTGSKLGKKYAKAVYCHPAYLTYMQSTSCRMPD